MPLQVCLPPRLLPLSKQFLGICTGQSTKLPVLIMLSCNFLQKVILLIEWKPRKEICFPNLNDFLFKQAEMTTLIFFLRRANTLKANFIKLTIQNHTVP